MSELRERGLSELVVRSRHRCFGGTVGFYRHASGCCNGDMNFSVYVPPQAAMGPVPVLYFLSGLTCTDENFMTKAGALGLAAELGILLVVPDTSPRGDGVADFADRYDIGQGAGFYVDATEEPWRSHYQMYSYITDELPAVIREHFPVAIDGAGRVRQSIFGHSMGGHGALICALRNPENYLSVSAFAPIVAPMSVPWGEAVFSLYLGDQSLTWANYDACELVARSAFDDVILIDQGLEDSFLKSQLQPERFATACRSAGKTLDLRFHEGYDHGYYFISSFVNDHLRHHARKLC
jgi:S-formylglutathione hydrolase